MDNVEKASIKQELKEIKRELKNTNGLDKKVSISTALHHSGDSLDPANNRNFPLEYSRYRDRITRKSLSGAATAFHV